MWPLKHTADSVAFELVEGLEDGSITLDEVEDDADRKIAQVEEPAREFLINLNQ